MNQKDMTMLIGILLLFVAIGFASSNNVTGKVTSKSSNNFCKFVPDFQYAVFSHNYSYNHPEMLLSENGCFPTNFTIGDFSGCETTFTTVEQVHQWEQHWIDVYSEYLELCK